MSDQEKGETEHLQKSKKDFIKKYGSYGLFFMITAFAFFYIGYFYALLPFMSFLHEWSGVVVLSITILALFILVYVTWNYATKLLTKKTNISKSAELEQLKAKLQLYITLGVAFIGGVIALWIFAYGAGRPLQDAFMTMLLTVICAAGAVSCILLYVVDTQKFGELLPS
jgi:energy-coupling factor transporter transmembrane protein EcfT